MTITFTELALYAFAVFVLFLTPGPVWVALIARGLSGGFQGAWPLALGVVVGDALWPVLAIFGITWVTSVFSGFMTLLQWAAVLIFVAMGVGLLRKSESIGGADSRLTRPGMWAGFIAGVAVILGNPKAILFYMGVLPGFFDLRTVSVWDICAITAVSIAVPLAGNLILAAFIDRVKALLSSPGRLRRVNVVSGWMLIGVGVVIALT
ncbi:MAG: threonine/homoserine/homoserine lactone efflux protein [Paracoccaceae bacterium]|jgi:threonine/homoserine/homoserine lactone efflux protein